MNKPHDPTFQIDEVSSSFNGTRFTPDAGETATTNLNVTMLEDERPFTYNRYAEEVHSPTPLPNIDVSSLQAEYPRCLDMPIRFAGQTEYSVPEEWEGLLPLIRQVIHAEAAHNRNWVDYNTYITVDCKHVVTDEQQRHGGLHVDGFQGTRINPKTKITRNYVVTTNGGTRFYHQKFDVADPNKFNVFQGFDLQAETFVVAPENVVHFMDAYTVHESGIADKAGLRTFLRVTYDLKKFDRAGNTHNNMLNYNWDMVARNVHEMVTTPTLQDVRNPL